MAASKKVAPSQKTPQVVIKHDPEKNLRESIRMLAEARLRSEGELSDAQSHSIDVLNYLHLKIRVLSRIVDMVAVIDCGWEIEGEDLAVVMSMIHEDNEVAHSILNMDHRDFTELSVKAAG